MAPHLVVQFPGHVNKELDERFPPNEEGTTDASSKIDFGANPPLVVPEPVKPLTSKLGYGIKAAYEKIELICPNIIFTIISNLFVISRSIFDRNTSHEWSIISMIT